MLLNNTRNLLGIWALGVTVVKLRIQPSTYPIVFLISLVLVHQEEEVTICMSARMGHARREWLLVFEEREYSILPVMSELSTVRCDRALGLWIADTRTSSVDRGGQNITETD